MHDTIESLIQSGAVIHWRCEVCRAGGKADLEAIRAAKGPDFTLSNRRPSCRICPGRVLFEDRSSVYFRRMDIHTDRDPAFWAYQDRERARLYALGWRVVMGKWVAPEGTEGRVSPGHPSHRPAPTPQSQDEV